MWLFNITVLNFRVIKVAKEFVDEGMTFAVSDKSGFGHETSALGLDTKEDPIAGIYDSKGKYAMEADFNVENLKQFVQQYFDGALESYVKSEPVPADNSGPVKVSLPDEGIECWCD